MLNHTGVRKALWLFLAVAALLSTWSHILDLLGLGFWGAQVAFWKGTLATGVTRFITLDALFLGTAVVLWMVMEARRLNIRFVWAYVAFGVLIAISAAVPLFMFMREGKLPEAERGGRLSAIDQLLVVVFVLMDLAYVGWAASAA
jgi:hypothetical protein